MKQTVVFLLSFLMLSSAFGQVGSFEQLYQSILDGQASATPATGVPGDGPEPFVTQVGRQTYYTSQAAFQTENPGLPLEDMELGTAGSGVVVTCGPIISAAASPCFAAGDFIAGLEITADSGGDTVILGPGVIGNPSICAGANTFVDATVLTFTGGGVNAVGMHLLTNAGTEALDIDIYGPGGLLASTTAMADGSGLFWGVNTGTDEIVEIVVASPTGNGELVDNIQFGSVARVPTLSTWGWIAFLVLLAGAGLFVVRRLRAA